LNISLCRPYIMLSLNLAVPSFAPVVSPVTNALRAAAPVMETVDDLKSLADAQQLPMGYWDPLKLAEKNFWDQGNEATIGWLRHAEIKHGRVAMAAFVGFCVQSNGIYFPWALKGGPLSDGDTLMYADLAAIPAPGDQWDAVPAAGKLQILFTILLLEWIGEEAQPHYMRGGKPGYYPSLKEASNVPHPVPFDLYDPFGLSKGKSEASKARGLVAEINNGRLAMIGILGFAAASKGLQVPGLDSVAGIQPYAGEYMAPFTLSDKLAFVPEMLDTFPKFPWF